MKNGHTIQNRWLTSADIMIMLGISDSNLKRMRKRKDIPFRKIGRTFFYPSYYFENLLLERTTMHF